MCPTAAGHLTVRCNVFEKVKRYLYCTITYGDLVVVACSTAVLGTTATAAGREVREAARKKTRNTITCALPHVQNSCGLTVVDKALFQRRRTSASHVLLTVLGSRLM